MTPAQIDALNIAILFSPASFDGVYDLSAFCPIDIYWFTPGRLLFHVGDLLNPCPRNYSYLCSFDLVTDRLPFEEARLYLAEALERKLISGDLNLSSNPVYRAFL